MGLADGIVVLDFVDRDEHDPHREQRFSEKLACPNGHPLAVDDLEPRSFSFNSPYGACPECSGLGIRKEVDPELVVPDQDRTLADGAVAPWSMGQSSEYFTRMLAGLGESMGFDMDTPWRKLPAKARKAILEGCDAQVHVRYRNRYGHPAEPVVQRYKALGIDLVENTRCGAARWVSLKPEVVHCERDWARRYWHHTVPP